MQRSHPAVSPSPTSRGIGEALPHDSAVRHVTGTALYVDDVPEPPGTLQLYLALSTVAHANLVSLDLSAVRTAPGVAAVFTAADVPGVNDCGPTPAHDDPVFADGVVHYVGQPLFVVAAETLAQARAAAKRAEIIYAAKPHIITLDQAIAAGSQLEAPVVWARGDALAQLAQSPHLIEGQIDIGGQEHFYLEPQGALALPAEGGDVRVVSSTQHPSEVQHKVAEMLGLQSHNVVVEVRRMGGAFGGKESQANLPALVAALVTHKTGRAAKIIYDRDDDFVITGKRHDFRVHWRVSFDDAGRLHALDVTHHVRCGFSFDLSQAIADRAMLHADNTYFIPHMRVASHRWRTNTQSNTAFRGFGGPQGMLAMERIIETVARHRGLDPKTVRERNFYAHHSAPEAKRSSTHYGMRVDDCVAQDLFAELATSSDYIARRNNIIAFNAKSQMIKRGIALTPVKFGISFTKTEFNQAGALVHIYADGSVMLNHGGTEMGQGLNQKVAQVVAQRFGIDVDQIKITATDTSKVPNTSATAASSGADLNGMAAANAADTLVQRLSAHLAQKHGVLADAVHFQNGRVHVGDAISLTFAAATRSAYVARVALSATGYYATPKITWDRVRGQGRPFFYFAYGAAVTEVAIDTLTGENRLLRVDILHDVGQSLNPAIDLGQVEGGFAQGVGWLTTEELVWDAAGKLTTHAPATYKIPVASDRAPDMRIALWAKGRNTERTIYRSKAVGEPPLMLGISALMALTNAVASVGSGSVEPQLDAPATPERILMAVADVRRRSVPPA